jgi:hypothetical protein
MAQPLMGSSAHSAVPHMSKSAVRLDIRAANIQPAVYWPIVVVVGAVAILVVVGATLGGYALSRKAPSIEGREAPLAAMALAEEPPQPAPETMAAILAVADDDPPPAKGGGNAGRGDLSCAKPDAAPPVSKVAKRAETPKPLPLPPTASFKQRNLTSADELSKQLLLAPEVGVEGVAAERLFLAGVAQRSRFPHSPPEELLKNPALIGLPVRMGLDCHLGKEASENLQVLSRKLRIYISESVPKDRIDTRPDVTEVRKKLFSGGDGERGDWKQAEAIPTLVQLLQAEDKPMRLLLVELLAGLKCREASAALAQRALFDLSEEVREAAVTALKTRPPEEYRDLFLKGLRYPWPAIADHGAEALVALKDGDALAKLVDLLDRPDPAMPYVKGTKAQQTVVREVVRINHFKNCVLCHAPSTDQNELVRGLVPDPKKPLPPAFSPQYYAAATGMFVRADVTYIKQDFAVPQPVAKPDVWPTNQRFDYLVRTRPATTREIEIASKKEPGTNYPQRESVLFALRELTGKDPGTSADAWRRTLATALTQSDGVDDP